MHLPEIGFLLNSTLPEPQRKALSAGEGSELTRDILHPFQGEEMRKFYGIKDNLVRFSVGIEAVEDVWADLKQALDQVKSGTRRQDLTGIPRYVTNGV